MSKNQATPKNETEGRRPLKSRQIPLFQKLASWLAKTRITPNMISVSSTAFATVSAGAMIATRFTDSSWVLSGCWVAAALFIQGRLIANLLDGMVAVEGGKGSPVGDLYNEVPDRVSDSLIFVAAGYSAGGIPEFGLAAALWPFSPYVRAIGASVSAGQVFLGPMAKPQRMALMTLTSVILALLSLIQLEEPIHIWVINGALPDHHPGRDHDFDRSTIDHCKSNARRIQEQPLPRCGRVHDARVLSSIQRNLLDVCRIALLLLLANVVLWIGTPTKP